jgi:hypothetical protein
MSNMPPTNDPEQDPGQEAPPQGGSQDEAISVTLGKEEAMQMLQLISSIGQQLDQQLQQMQQAEQGQGEVDPDSAAPPPAAAAGNAPDISNGMGPQAAALQQMLIARQKNK